MITLKWARASGADVVSFRLYRAIIGFIATKNVAAFGKTLELKVDGGGTQVINLVSDFVADINATLIGGKAYNSQNDNTKFLVRSNTRSAPGSIEIVGGTALSDLGLVPLLITEKSDTRLLAQIPIPTEPDDVVTFEDKDGVLEDFYALSTVDSSAVESNMTQLTRAATPNGPLCEIEGTVIDLMGVPVPDAEVKATLVSLPTNTNARAYVGNQTLCTRTDTSGNFSLTVLQNTIIRLQVPSVNYDQNIRVPERSFIVLSELKIDTDYRYPTEYIGG